MERGAAVLFPKRALQFRAPGLAHRRVAFLRCFPPTPGQWSCLGFPWSTGPLSFAWRPPVRRAAIRADALGVCLDAEKAGWRVLQNDFNREENGYSAHAIFGMITPAG